MRRKTWIMSLLAVLMVMAMVAACGPAVDDDPEVDPDPDPDEEPDPVEPDEPTELRMGLAADATNLDPRLATDVYSANINNLVYAGLLTWDDETLEIEPYVAEEIEIPDDTTYIFHLHEGIKFHDGEELTAEDVKYTYDTFRDPDFGARNIAFYEPIDEIVVVDDYTVEFRMEEPNAPFLYYLAPGIIPKHHADEHGDEVLQTEPMGAGPYVFQEWVPNDRIVLEAHEDFFQGELDIDEIIFRPIPEVSTKLIELETGGVHVIDGIPPEEVERLREEPEVEVTVRPGTGFNYFSYHHTEEPFDDVRMRQAFAYGIDMEALVDHVYYGIRDVAYSPIIPTSWAHNPDVRKFGHEPEEAQSLMEEAGYGDGITVDFKHSEGEVTRELVEITQHQLAEIGLNLEVHEQEWGAFYDDVLDGDFEAYTIGWSGQTDPDRGVYRQFHSRNWAPEGANRQLYSNERVDELLDAARTNVDQDVREGKYHEIQEILAEDQSYTCISYYVTKAAHRPEVQNYEGRCGYFYTLPLKDATLTE